MDRTNALAVWKAIMRRHPFFREGGMFGFDMRTFAICYPHDAAILVHAIMLSR